MVFNKTADVVVNERCYRRGHNNLYILISLILGMSLFVAIMARMKLNKDKRYLDMLARVEQTGIPEAEYTDTTRSTSGA